MYNLCQNPNNYPLKPSSGKIEIYSKVSTMKNIDTTQSNDKTTPLTIDDTIQMYVDPLTTIQPLKLMRYPAKGSANSQYRQLPVLLKVEEEDIWIHPIDAKRRNIHDGDTVKVFNNHGQMQLIAKVTARILPGVVTSAKGILLQQETFGASETENINEFTDPIEAATHGASSHTNLVEVVVA